MRILRTKTGNVSWGREDREAKGISGLRAFPAPWEIAGKAGRPTEELSAFGRYLM
jgi:hypothetical protein